VLELCARLDAELAEDACYRAKPVKADWSRFAPTNAVNQYQYGLT
jgi:hypothetical protein